MDDESPTPQDAHKAEILEALLEATLRGDADEFFTFNEEWERIDPIDEDGMHIRFPKGSPIPYTASGYCFHCQERWVVQGVAFGVMIPGLSQMIHLQGECPNRGDCACWIEDTEAEDRPFGFPRCMRCGRSEPICECDDVVALGPCAAFERYEKDNGFGWVERS